MTVSNQRPPTPQESVVSCILTALDDDYNANNRQTPPATAPLECANKALRSWLKRNRSQGRYGRWLYTRLMDLLVVCIRLAHPLHGPIYNRTTEVFVQDLMQNILATFPVTEDIIASTIGEVIDQMPTYFALASGEPSEQALQPTIEAVSMLFAHDPERALAELSRLPNHLAPPYEV